jgi:YesN/AraC family two-component response regulator
MSEQPTILIIDDSRVSRMMIKSIIVDNHEHWNILEAANADEAVSVSEQNDIQLMIIDYNMPGRNGLEVAVDLIKLHPKAHKFMLSANIQDSIKEKAELLTLKFVSKPITEDSIKSIISVLE